MSDSQKNQAPVFVGIPFVNPLGLDYSTQAVSLLPPTYTSWKSIRNSEVVVNDRTVKSRLVIACYNSAHGWRYTIRFARIFLPTFTGACFLILS